MEVCFVVPANLYITPYLKRYLDILDMYSVNYDIIYWNRHGLVESINEKNIHIYNKFMDEENSKITKFKSYFGFANFVKRILYRNRYDRVFILGTVLGVFLYPFLKLKYNNRYILDIRDYSYENIRLFYLIEKKLVKNSLQTIISSEGYKKFLPSHNYVIVHNVVDWDKLDICINNRKTNGKKTVNIVYLGLVRFFEQDKKLITKLGNDPRFHINYIGKNANKLEKLIDNYNITNVTLEPKLLPEDTMKYYAKADIINNLYGNNKPSLDYALSNKLYHAAQMRIPILVCPNTYMEEISCKYNFGITIDLEEENIADKLYEKFIEINWEKLGHGCNEFLEKVNHDNLKFEKAVKAIILQ